MQGFTKRGGKQPGGSKRTYAPVPMAPVAQGQYQQVPQVQQFIPPLERSTPIQVVQVGQGQSEPPAPELKGGQWSEEQLSAARASAKDLFDAPINTNGTRRVRITQFGDSIGIDIREFMIGKFGELAGQPLPSQRGIRLRVDEWQQLKQVSGDIDQALAPYLKQQQ